jgi:5-methylthioadenosine/S-adenosylhomocysteine deaminase
MGLAVTNARLDGDAAGLRAEGGKIAELGPEVEPRSGDEVIDAGGMALLPGLVNAHTHAAMTLFRGYADDLPLMEWLEHHIWPAERRMDEEDVYWGTRLACLEMVRSGTVSFWDMYWYPAAVARAVDDAGLRAVAAAPLIDGSGGAEGAAAARKRARGSLDAVRAAAGGRVSAGLAPHAIYTVGEPSLRWVAELAGELELPVQIHLSETESEVTECVEQHGLRPAAYLDRVGLLGERTVLAHGTWLDQGELELIAERGATVVTNPVANLKLAVGGIFPYLSARRHGVRVGIGTDGPGSNNSLDMLADVKTFALLQKNVAGDPSAVTAKEAWEVATGQRSPLLAGAALEPGGAADFLLVRTHTPELSLGELHAGLVYAASGAVVDTTVVAGRVVMRDRRIEGEDDVRAHAVERARRLGLVPERVEA